MSILSGPRIRELVSTACRVHGEPAVPYLDITPYNPAPRCCNAA